MKTVPHDAEAEPGVPCFWAPCGYPKQAMFIETVNGMAKIIPGGYHGRAVIVPETEVHTVDSVYDRRGSDNKKHAKSWAFKPGYTAKE